MTSAGMHSVSRFLFVVLLVAGLTGVHSGCAGVVRATGAVGTLPRIIDESSGLVASNHRDDLLWTHNDSGDTPRIFAIDLEGNLVGEVAIEGALASDWEAITSDGNGRLLIGDIGNNENQRRDLTVYVVEEPDPSAQSVIVEKAVRFRYPEQKSFPDRDYFNFDAEALFWWKDRLFLLTKHRSDKNTALYVFPEVWDDDKLDLIRISETTLGSMVTDAAISPDGEHLAVLTYAAIFIFAAPEEGYDFLANRVKSIEFHTNVSMQIEGMAWVGDSLYIANEQRGLHRLHNPLAPGFRMYP